MRPVALPPRHAGVAIAPKMSPHALIHSAHMMYFCIASVKPIRSIFANCSAIESMLCSE